MRGVVTAGIVMAGLAALGGMALPAAASPARPPAADAASAPDAVRAVLAPHLSPAELARALSDRAAVRRIAGLLRRLEEPGARDLSVEVEAEAIPGGGRAVYVSLRRLGSLERSDTDRYWHGRSAYTVDEVALVVPPAAAPRPSPPVALPPALASPDALPAGAAPCAPTDDACWRHQSWALLEARPPACEPYLREQEDHLRRMGAGADPNGTAACSDLDPGAAERDRQARLREVAGAYPSGAIETSNRAIPERITVTNRPPTSAPEPTDPGDACLASLQEGAVAAVPALDCTRDATHWRAWRKDPLATASRATLGLIRSLPGVDFALSRRARALADDRSPEGLWAALWVERWEAARQRGDADWQDRAARRLAANPEERRVLADRARRWLSRPAQAPWHGALRALYEERFASLYPGTAGPDGLPDLGRYPTRLWWATNWLAEAARRGWSPAIAAERLRCGPDGERAAAVLRDLSAPLSRDPRFLSLLPGMLAGL